jgi:hypothetical protein
MAKPFTPELQGHYELAERTIRLMDSLDGCEEAPLDALQTAIFALEAGLATAIAGTHRLDDAVNSNSAFDALVMLHELRERLAPTAAAS